MPDSTALRLPILNRLTHTRTRNVQDQQPVRAQPVLRLNRIIRIDVETDQRLLCPVGRTAYTKAELLSALPTEDRPDLQLVTPHFVKRDHRISGQLNVRQAHRVAAQRLQLLYRVQVQLTLIAHSERHRQAHDPRPT